MIITGYNSPLGRMIMSADDSGTALTMLKFDDSLDKNLCFEHNEPEVFAMAREWLDAYFAKKTLPKMPPICLHATPFQCRVWKYVSEIPYGSTVSYGTISKKMGVPFARAIGRAVGSNPVHIMIPCHRVIASSGALTGYAAGIDRKKALLELESILLKM